LLTAIHINLAQIRHPRGLSAALAWAADRDPSSLSATQILLSVAKVGLPAACDRLLSLYTAGAFSRFAGESLAGRIDVAAVIAARNATSQAVAADVCSDLIGTRDVQLQIELAKTIPAIRAYKLYDAVRTWLGESPDTVVRAVAAISLSEHGALKSHDAFIEELDYADPDRLAPLFAVALSYFGRSQAVDPLIRGLKVSLLDGDDATHDLYAAALTRIGSQEALEACRKWYRRI
jgi:hypothetical protein